MLNSMIIVVADDQEADFQLTEIALRNFHPILESARTLRHARQMLKNRPVSVILLDRGIPLNDEGPPECSLDQWCDFIEEHRNGCAIVIYTGHVSLEDQERAIISGAVDYLDKSHVQRFPEQFAARIKEASEFFLRNKSVLDGQAKLEKMVRETRAVTETIRQELNRIKGSKSSEVYKAGKRAGQEHERRVQMAKRIGKETGAWGVLIACGLSAYHGILWLWHWGSIAGEFIKSIKAK